MTSQNTHRGFRRASWMARALVVLLLLGMVTGGCKRKPDSGTRDTPSAGSTEQPKGMDVEPVRPARPAPMAAKSPRPKGNLLQVPIGGNGSAQPRLVFRITKVYQNRKPTKKPPWHASGGKWFFFDAQAAGASFTFGVKSQPLQGLPLERATGILVAGSPKDRTNFLAALGKAFRTPTKGVAPKHPIKPFRMAGAIFNRKGTRLKGGGFRGAGGTWVTSKFTLEGKDDNAEVFINWNPATKEGEFAEKDATYRKPLLDLMTKAMRDGKAN